MTQCPRCNATLPQPPERFCPSCGSDLSTATQPTDSTVVLPPPVPPAAGGGGGGYGAGGGGGWGAPPPPPAGGGGTPWDRRDQIGIGAALLETTQMLYTDPGSFFRSMPVTGGLVSPLIYGLIVGYIGLIASTIYNLVTQSVMGTGFLSQLGDNEMTARLAPFLAGGGLTGAILNLIFGPFVIAIVLFVWAGILHVVLMILGAAGRGFEATFRVTCFAYAGALLNIIPICGGLLGFVWTVVLTVIGLSEAQQTTKGKAAVAVLAPVFLCCCCVGLGVFGIISMVASQVR